MALPGVTPPTILVPCAMACSGGVPCHCSPADNPGYHQMDIHCGNNPLELHPSDLCRNNIQAAISCFRAEFGVVIFQMYYDR